MSIANRIKLTTAQARPIVAATFPDYHGRKFFLEFAEEVLLYDTNWSGGTCNKYAAIHADGLTVNLRVPAPWINTVEGTKIPLSVDVLIVEHSYFCGTDCGIRIYAHPSHAPKFLPATV